ncbi:MAG: dihydropteroate synthase [Firmicutes bacterium]|nr:dihydropteroate synthase [Bacillota bacterium]MDH7495324.1 dihydropteroate synthase [Bacillota bacterium]
MEDGVTAVDGERAREQEKRGVASHNARLILVNDEGDLEREMRDIGVAPEGVSIMVPKGVFRVIRLERVPLRAAILIKEEMLSKGGEAAVSDGVASLSTDSTDVLLMGTARTLRRAAEGLLRQPFGLRDIAREIIEVLDTCEPPVARTRRTLKLREHTLALGERTYIMGIVNVTPDSFSDGGQHCTTEAAVEHARRLVEEGADIVDIGGESTRPGAEPVPLEEEMARVIPVVKRLAAEVQVPISVDTYKSEVAEAALAAGAHMVNDISGLRLDERLGEVVARAGVPVVLMHMKGLPRDMQDNPQYDSVVGEILGFFRDAVARAEAYGIPRDSIVIDPGIGFGKTVAHNLEILRRLKEFRSLGLPILVGTSRKSLIGKVLNLPVDQRLEGTAATVALAIASGADIVRVHDVRYMSRVARMADAIVRGGAERGGAE